MSEENTAYAKGDWIVHTTYGLGQIMAIEKKRLAGKARAYYRVRDQRQCVLATNRKY